MNPYQHYVSEFVSLVKKAKSLPRGGIPPAPRPPIHDDARVALFFAPHPDDETISGGMALRLMREAGMRVFNVAVTQGSKQERRSARLKELQSACEYLGFGLITAGPNGLERINPTAREKDPTHWSACVRVIKEILNAQRPQVILFPHHEDWNSTHIGTHLLVMDALKEMPTSFECFIIETEFWGQMDDPNLMIEISEEDLGDLIAATSFHAGEVERNPYHVMMPAWMLDNVRRGSELVGGQGGAAPDFTFALLHRLRKWGEGKAGSIFEGGQQVPKTANIGQLFQ